MLTGFSCLGSEPVGRPNVVMESRFPWQVFPSELNGLWVARHENCYRHRSAKDMWLRIGLNKLCYHWQGGKFAFPCHWVWVWVWVGEWVSGSVDESVGQFARQCGWTATNSNQQQPAANNSNKQQPTATKGNQQQLTATNSNQQQPTVIYSKQHQPAATNSNQQQPTVTNSNQQQTSSK